MRLVRVERQEEGAAAPARSGQSGSAGVTRSRPQLLGLGAAVLAVVLLLSVASPPPAHALPVGPIDVGPLGGLGGLLGGVTGGIAKVAVGAFDAIIKALFAPIAKFITTELIGWLVAVPNLTQGNVAQLEQTVEAMGGGLLGAVATISTIRYWAAGFAGGGDSGFAALEGLTRTVAAALFLAVWPWLFDTAVSLTNLFTSSLLGSGAVVHSVSHLLAAGLGAGVALNFTPIGLFLNIAMAVAASLLFLGLLAGEDRGQYLHDPGVHRHAARGRGLAGSAVDRPRGDARFRRLPAGAGDVGAVLRRLRGGEPERDQLQRRQRDEHAA